MSNAAIRDTLIDVIDAADYLGIKKQTLDVWRSTGRYESPFIKVGRSVKYRMSDLQAFVARRVATSTGQASRL
jgi:excisionase family DNA binding protein